MICATLQTATACVNSPLNFIHFSLKNMFKKLSKFAKIIGSRNYYFYFCFRGIFLFDSFFCFKLIVSLNKRLKYLPNLFHLLVDNLVNVLWCQTFRFICFAYLEFAALLVWSNPKPVKQEVSCSVMFPLTK